MKKVFSQGDKITVRGKGGELELWADVEISVPDGSFLEVRHGVGRMDAQGVTGDLNLGPVTALDIKGGVPADTGSGSVKLACPAGGPGWR